MARGGSILVALAVAAVIGCSGPAANPAAHADKAIAAGEIGSRLPEFHLKGLAGREIDSAQLTGKVVLIDFWATWCAPCKQEMPGYQKLMEQYGSRGFTVIGLKFDTIPDTEDPLEFAKRIGVRYPLAVASDDLSAKFGGIEGLPTTMIYDRKGVLRKKIIGFEYTEVVEKDVESLH